jgi:hypothetical protein
MVVSPTGAAGVAVVGLLLGVCLVVSAAERGTSSSERPRRVVAGLPGGWALIVLSVVLMLLAVPTASETAPPPPRQVAPSPSPATRAPMARPGVPNGPG